MLRRLLVPLAAAVALFAPAAGPATTLTASTAAADPAAAASAAPAAGLITNLSVKDAAQAARWSVQANLQRGNHIYPDRTYTFTAVPAVVAGADWIQDTGNSKTFTGNPLATFGLTASANVYVGLDRRTTRPRWLDTTWTATTAVETASAGITYRLFRKSFAAGTVSLGPIGPSTAQAMYTIAVVGTGIVTSDFSLSVQPGSQTVTAGASATYTVHTQVVSGTPDAINLTAAGLPAGASVTFNPNPVAPGSDATMTVATTTTTPNGSSTITVTGQDSAASHMATTSLTVGPPPPNDFSIALAPGSQTVTEGQSTTFTVTVATVSGHPDAVTLSASVPQSTGVSVSFGTNPVTPTAAGATSTLTVTTTASASPGSFTLTVSGTDSFATHQAGSSLVVAAAGGNPYGDPGLVSIFDGSTLNGWTPSAAGGWIVSNGAIHGTGTAGRGWIYYNKQQYGSFRWIFQVRQVVGNHAPTVLVWGTTTPIRDALSAIQFQPPNGGHWDYRPGHNNGGGAEFTTFPHTAIDIHGWSQCEILANQSTGVIRMACCPLGTSTTPCKAVEVLDFHDKTAAVVGPLAIQVHNGGIQDEYRGLLVESPVADPTRLITT